MSQPIRTPEAFLRRVRKTSGCWFWTGYCDRDGYGRVQVDGERIGAHRLAYELFVGPLGASEDVCHTCDTPSCVRPDHLWRGTNAENTADRHRKRRDARGEINGNAVLTPSLVAQIRADRRRGASYRMLVRSFGISKTQVARIVRRIHWAAAILLFLVLVAPAHAQAPPALDEVDALRIENAQLEILLLEERVQRLKAARDRLIDAAAHKANLDPRRYRPDVGSKTWRLVEPKK